MFLPASFGIHSEGPKNEPTEHAEGQSPTMAGGRALAMEEGRCDGHGEENAGAGRKQ